MWHSVKKKQKKKIYIKKKKRGWNGEKVHLGWWEVSCVPSAGAWKVALKFCASDC